MSLDLEKLSEEFKKILYSFTKEDLEEWLKQDRINMKNQGIQKEKLIVQKDMICPVLQKHCDDECCPVGAECNLSKSEIQNPDNKEEADKKLWEQVDQTLKEVDARTEKYVKVSAIEELLKNLIENYNYLPTNSKDMKEHQAYRKGLKYSITKLKALIR